MERNILFNDYIVIQLIVFTPEIAQNSSNCYFQGIPDRGLADNVIGHAWASGNNITVFPSTFLERNDSGKLFFIKNQV